MSIVRVSDGKPASSEELARLRAAILSQLAALVRRSEFFQVLPRRRFEALREGYRSPGRAASAVYKDVAMTENGRDFVFAASCQKLSGDCNESVARSSYKKGELVSPEDLNAMWAKLQDELDPEEAEDRRPQARVSCGAARAPARTAARAAEVRTYGAEPAGGLRPPPTMRARRRRPLRP